MRALQWFHYWVWPRSWADSRAIWHFGPGPLRPQRGPRPAAVSISRTWTRLASPARTFSSSPPAAGRNATPSAPPMPAGRVSARSRKRTRTSLRQILETAARSRPAPGSPGSYDVAETLDQKLGDFYAACMDEKAHRSRRHQTARTGNGAHRRDFQPGRTSGRGGPAAQPGRSRPVRLRLRPGRQE